MKELVLQGERHCRAGEWRQAVACLERALVDASASSDDCDAAARTFGPIFGQLGVAYFFLGDLPRAIAAHGEEATLNARADNAEAEAKAREGLGNAYKHAARHDEAIAAFERQLDLATTLENKVGPLFLRTPRNDMFCLFFAGARRSRVLQFRQCVPRERKTRGGDARRRRLVVRPRPISRVRHRSAIEGGRLLRVRGGVARASLSRPSEKNNKKGNYVVLALI